MTQTTALPLRSHTLTTFLDLVPTLLAVASGLGSHSTGLIMHTPITRTRILIPSPPNQCSTSMITHRAIPRESGGINSKECTFLVC